MVTCKKKKRKKKLTQLALEYVPSGGVLKLTQEFPTIGVQYRCVWMFTLVCEAISLCPVRAHVNEKGEWACLAETCPSLFTVLAGCSLVPA